MKKRLVVPLLSLLLSLCMILAVPVSASAGDGEEAPVAVAAFSKNGLTDQVISFSEEDFQVSGGAVLTSIVIDTLPDPAAGLLTIGGQAVPQDCEIAMSAVDGLRFTPLATPMLSATEFTFTPVFSGGLTGDAVTVGLFLLTHDNAAPVAEDLALSTYKNVEVQGTFAAVDPDGDILTFKLVSKPARGSVTLAEDGTGAFTYTPYENKTGKDAFTYVAVDTVGNTSSPATVSVKIEKQKTKVTYSDMTGVEGHREALHLAEAGLLIGEQMGKEYLFHPEEAMSRAEFTALAMAVADKEVSPSALRTGFADDDAISTWAKPYVSSALRAGVVQGTLDESGRVVFQAKSPVTAAEAAVILNRALGVTDVVSTAAVPEEALWYAQAVANLDSVNALPASAALQEPLTRAQAAVMLSGALDVMDSRSAGSWWPWG